ncbi:MAG: SOS response-associated peptidase family protein, partial [Betaproteobacteria bacterium]|nr:SOS response-associated peptidase family protein [Betaproteobacteria bacterium]
MCGRYVSPDEAAIERFFHVGGPKDNPFRRLFNAAPTMRLLVYRGHPEHGREVVPLHWGLIPSRAKDSSIGSRMIN